MQKIKLNKNMGKLEIAHGYVLDPRTEYVINYDDEMKEQYSFLLLTQMFDSLAINDYHKWLESNGFSSDFPNPTLDILKEHYGRKCLWKTELSQGLVMKDTDDDYCIVMECSRLNTGFKYSQIVLGFASEYEKYRN